jgi:hypothetical protein
LVKAVPAAHPSFYCVSIDAIIYEKYGIPHIDYEASSALYEQYQAETDDTYLATFRKLPAKKRVESSSGPFMQENIEPSFATWLRTCCGSLASLFEGGR